MKKIFTLLFLGMSLFASAQWSDYDNNFEDSLHMPAGFAPGTQTNPIVLTSYPDEGYFVIWEDYRNNSTTKSDIYAQKYDILGRAQWAEGGIPIANGANAEHYTFSSSLDYRNRSIACTDSAGGFYITYVDDSVTNYVWQRLMVQHVNRNGGGVFPAPGYILTRSYTANYQFTPQLIADGDKGFYIAWRSYSSNEYVNAYCYKDVDSTLRLFGGARMNENAIQTSSIAPCGIKTDVVYPGTNVIDFNIWSDGQGGCNLLMDINGNIGGQHRMLAYNRLWRAKKNAFSTIYVRNTSGTACPRLNTFEKGYVYPLYTLRTDFQSVFCGGGTGPVYAYTNYRLLSNGYQLVDEADKNDYWSIKGITMPTAGNVAVDFMAVTTRTLTGNSWSPWVVKAFTYRSEIFDSIPIQQSSYNNPDIGYNPAQPPGLNKVNFFRDTLLSDAVYAPDFSLAGGGKNVYAAGLMGSGARTVRLQHLEINRKSADSFAIEYKTNPLNLPEKKGVAIGAEISTGFGSYNIFYDIPLLYVAKNGQGFFSIREYYRSARISPIGTGVSLLWGAMGRSMSTGAYNGSSYNLEQPSATLNSSGEIAFMGWRDNKFLPGNTGDNIFVRRIGDLHTPGYLPPLKSLKPIVYYSTETFTNPAVLYGTTNVFSPLEVYNSYNAIGTSPVVSVLDNNYLGSVLVRIYQHINNPVRRYNGEPYLNRNYNFKADSIPPNAAITMQFFFTTAEFNAMKAADPTITNPGLLSVIWQPATVVNPPSTYTPVLGEKVLTPIAWDSVVNGFYITVVTPGNGNYFLRKEGTLTVCAGSPASFTSNITGSTYRWQVNTGSGFTDISNNATYSGATTATLQISSTTAALNGYRYRCMVNTSNASNTFSLLVANTWTGTVNNTWENAGNWSCGKVPDATTDVIIKSGTVTVNTTTATCRSITISPGASLNIAPGFKLTVTH